MGLPDGTGPDHRENLPNLPEPVQAAILQHYHDSPSYGVVFEAPPEDAGGEDFNSRLSRICAFFGSVVSLSPFRSLLIFPKSMDSELVVHRLTKSLKTPPLIVFEADDPGQAAARLSGLV